MAGSFQERVRMVFDTDSKLGGLNKLIAGLGKAQALAKDFGRDMNIAFRSNRIPGGKGGSIKTKGLSRLDVMQNQFDALTESSNRLSSAFGRIGLRSAAAFETMSGAASTGTSMFRRFKGRVIGSAGAIKNLSLNTRALQMRLLGLQFTMLTVAFIFGGLMAGALGAVGVFKVLGSTLKFLFLPTALKVLDKVLALQEAVFGMDESTRELIGDVFAVIAGLAIFVGLAAALGKAIIPLVGIISSLFSVLTFLVSPLGIVIGLLVAAAAVIGLMALKGGETNKMFDKMFKKVSKIAKKLFKFTSKAAKKISKFLQKMFDQIVNWFINANWGKIWGKVFNFASEARDKAAKFLRNMVSKITKFFKSQKWDKIWASFMDFANHGVGALTDFLANTYNGIIKWAANADWGKIWDQAFKFTQGAAQSIAEFAGMAVGHIIQFFEKVKWGKLISAIIKAAGQLGDTVLDAVLPGGDVNKAKGPLRKIADSFMKGFRSVGKDVKRASARQEAGAATAQQFLTVNQTINTGGGPATERETLLGQQRRLENGSRIGLESAFPKQQGGGP